MLFIYTALQASPTVEQFVGVLKTNTITDLAFRGMCGTNFTVMDDQHSLLRICDASPLSPSTSNGKEHPNVASDSFHVVVKVQQKVAADVHEDDMDVFSAPYANGFIATQLLHGVNHDACKACLTFQVMLLTTAFIYKNVEQSVILLGS